MNEASFLRVPALALLASLSLIAACGDEANKDTETSDSGVEVKDAGDDDVDCKKEDQGTVCGDDKHCIDKACVTNTCGDGVAAGDEECDDGNQETGDGCTPSCREAPLECGDGVVQDGEECDDGNWFDLDACTNMCTENVCGNGREDGEEECDDGNRLEDDDCTNACQENRCRNGRLDPGEECDDGNRTQDDGCTNACVLVMCGNGRIEDAMLGGNEECDDGNDVDNDKCANACTKNECGNSRIDPGEACDGDTGTMDCSDDCKTTVVATVCPMCREKNCRNFMDVLDLVDVCLENDDARFRMECTAVMECARKNRCGFGEAGGSECFCGSVEINECQTPGEADGPCQAEWYAAARTTMLAEMIGRFTDIALPSGSAYFLLQCERDFCAAECAP